MKNVFILLILLIGYGCAAKAQNAQTPSEQERYKSAAEYSARNRGVSVLILKGGEIVFEEYQNGKTATTPWILASGTKSFAGVMLAAAVEDKLVKSFDEKVSDTITEWKSDRRKNRITLRELLSLTSGIDAGRLGLVPTYREAVDFPAEAEAGASFAYGPVPFQIFGEVMRRKLAQRDESVIDYLKRRVLDPIGLKVDFWRRGADDNPLFPQGAALTAREWIKFGQFLKDGGRWRGRQIIAKKHLDELVKGTEANPAYGITFWLNRAGIDPRGAATAARVATNGDEKAQVKDLYMAAGAGNQRLYIIPSLDLVVVRQGNFGRWDDQEFLGRLLFGKTR